MSKIIVIGDTHGHNTWKKVIEKETFDKVVFLGDYVDSFGIKPEEIVKNLQDIVEYKENNKEKCILLYGNHEHSYVNYERCSGYNIHAAKSYDVILDRLYKERLIDIIYIHNDIIMSHAGVSQEWLTKVAQLDKVEDIHFNNLSLYTLNFNLFSGYNSYGDTISQSPIWIRPSSLLKSKVEGYRQIVGHTPIREPKEIDGIYFNDLMPNYYIVIEDNEITYKKLEE